MRKNTKKLTYVLISLVSILSYSEEITLGSGETRTKYQGVDYIEVKKGYFVPHYIQHPTELNAHNNGYGSIADNFNSVTFGAKNKATGDTSFAFGTVTEAIGRGSTSFGVLTSAKGNFSTAFGDSTTAKGTSATAFGNLTVAEGEDSTAFGDSTYAMSGSSTAFGIQTMALGESSTSFGVGTKTEGRGSTAFGVLTEAKGDYSTAFGAESIANGDISTAFGYKAVTNADYSLAFNGKTHSDYAIALGKDAEAGVENQDPVNDIKNVVAIGNGAKSRHSNSVALGEQAETKEAVATITAQVGGVEKTFAGTSNGVVSVGKKGFEKQVVNVGAGEISETSTDAINGSQLHWVKDLAEGNKTGKVNINLDNITSDGANIIKDNAKNAVGVNGDDLYISVEEKDIPQEHKKSFKVKFNEAKLDEKLNQKVATSVTNITQNISNNVTKVDEKIEKVKKKNGQIRQELENQRIQLALQDEKIEKIKGIDKDYVDNSVNGVKGGVASVVASANIPQVAYDKLFSVGFGAGYYDKHGAIAAGISGQDKGHNTVYKASVGVDFTGKFNAGAGVNYSFGKTGVSKSIERIAPKVNKVEKYDDTELRNIIEKQGDIINNLASKIKMLENRKNSIITLDNFIVDKWDIDKTNLDKVKLAKKIIDSNSDIVIEIIGYADTRMNNEYNLELGLNRALSVKRKLVSLGIDKKIPIRIISMGENSIPSLDKAKQRKVEIVIKTNLEIR